ncbi:MAG: flagellar basal body-associated FliL family protein [Candidatus Latescibacterota bacterium]|jgi:flagellar basal body-associated protein FliL
MAEDETAADGETGAKPEAGSGPGRYFVLVLLILLIEGSVGYWVLDRAIPAPEVPEETAPEEEEEVVVWTPPIYYEALKELIVEPTSLRGRSMVRLSLVLEVDDQAVIEELTLRHTVIWDLVLRRLELLDERDFRDPQKKKLKEDLIKMINAELKNPGVLNVFITDIIMQ